MTCVYLATVHSKWGDDYTILGVYKTKASAIQSLLRHWETSIYHDTNHRNEVKADLEKFDEYNKKNTVYEV